MGARLIFLMALLLAVRSAGAQPLVPWVLGQPVPEEPGQDYESPSGLRFHLQIVENQFCAVFFDEERLAVPPPVEQIVVRGEERRNKTNNFVLPLKPAPEGFYLAHPRHRYPPYEYWITLVVSREGAESEVIPRELFTQEAE